MDPILKIEGLNFYYQEFAHKKQVLFDINLLMNPGEIVIMTGESGSGKTTLLSLIGCLRSVEEGSIKIFGQELRGSSEKTRMKLRRSIGYIFQSFNLLDFLIIRQNVQVSLECKPNFNPHKSRVQTETILHEVGLGHRINAYPRELSGGQKQRVAIARALVHQPGLVLADEPTAALDRKTGREAIELICRLAKQQGSAVLIVTHDSRILDVADRIVRIEDGRLGMGVQETMSLALPSLSEEQLDKILPKLELLTYQAGETIIKQGDIADKFYTIVQGEVDIFQEKPDSEEVFLTKLYRNDYFGEIGLLQQSKRTATVRASGDSEVTLMAIDREIFSNMISESNATYAIISQQATQRLIEDLQK
jgi:putative ABC transport system ATP-binding protein